MNKENKYYLSDLMEQKEIKKYSDLVFRILDNDNNNFTYVGSSWIFLNVLNEKIKGYRKYTIVETLEYLESGLKDLNNFVNEVNKSELHKRTINSINKMYDSIQLIYNQIKETQHNTVEQIENNIIIENEELKEVAATKENKTIYELDNIIIPIQHNNYIDNIEGYKINNKLGYYIEDNYFVLTSLENGIRLNKPYNNYNELITDINENKNNFDNVLNDPQYKNYINTFNNKLNYKEYEEYKNIFSNTIGIDFLTFTNDIGIIAGYEIFDLYKFMDYFKLEYNNNDSFKIFIKNKYGIEFLNIIEYFINPDITEFTKQTLKVI